MHKSRRRFLQQVPGMGTALLASGSFAGLSEMLNGDQVAIEAAEAAASLQGSKRLRLLLPEGSQSNLMPVIAAFEATTKVKVVTQVAPVDDINTKIFLSATNKAADFDVALPATYGLADLVSAQTLLPLDDLAAKHQPSNFLQDSLYNIGDRYDGSLYGYQTDGDVYLMFYNLGLLDGDQGKRYQDTFGRDVALPEQWSDVDAMMAFVHNPSDRRFGGNLFRNRTYTVWEFWLRMHAKGVLPFDNSLRPQLTADGAVEALVELLAASKHQAAAARTDGLFENWSAYGQGESLVNIGWGGSQKSFNLPTSKVQGKLQYSSAPGPKQGIPYFNWGWSYSVAANTAHPNLAYLFILFATSPAISTMAVRAPTGFFDPFRRGHYSDGAIQDSYSPEFLSVHEQALSNSMPDLYLRGQSDYMDVLRRYIDLAQDGLITPKRALQAVSKIWSRLNREFGEDQQTRRWQEIYQAYPQSLTS